MAGFAGRLSVALTAGALVSGAVTPRPAAAQSAAAAQARERYEAGLRYFNLAEYQRAIQEFKQAYQLSPAPELLYNIAQAHRLAGDCATALRFYKNYVREKKGAANRPEVTAAMAKCEKALATPEEATAPPPAEAPPAPAAPTPPPPATTLPPRASHSPASSSATRSPAGPGVVPEATVREQEERPAGWLRPGGLALAAVGGGFVVAGLWEGKRVRDIAREVDRDLGEGERRWSEKLLERDRDGREAEARGYLFGLLGAGALVAGGALAWYGHRAVTGPSVALTPQSGGGMAVVRGRF